MRTAADILQQLKDNSVTIRDHYKKRAEEYDKMAADSRGASNEAQEIIDDCERALIQLRN